MPVEMYRDPTTHAEIVTIRVPDEIRSRWSRSQEAEFKEALQFISDLVSGKVEPPVYVSCISCGEGGVQMPNEEPVDEGGQKFVYVDGDWWCATCSPKSVKLLPPGE